MWDFFTERERKARKSFKCEEAGCEIKAGDRYSYGAGKCEGTFMTAVLCLDCRLLTTEMIFAFGYDDGYPATECRKLLSDEHRITEDPIAWARSHRDARLTQAALLKIPESVATEVLAERRRQIRVKDWTPKHDDEHTDGELGAAAAAYALSGSGLGGSELWPWSPMHFNRACGRRDLIKAGALIIAEIERLDRAAARAVTEAGGTDV